MGAPLLCYSGHPLGSLDHPPLRQPPLRVLGPQGPLPLVS